MANESLGSAGSVKSYLQYHAFGMADLHEGFHPAVLRHFGLTSIEELHVQGSDSGIGSLQYITFVRLKTLWALVPFLGAGS